MLTHRQMWNYNSHSHVYQMWLRITNQIYCCTGSSWYQEWVANGSGVTAEHSWHCQCVTIGTSNTVFHHRCQESTAKGQSVLNIHPVFSSRCVEMAFGTVPLELPHLCSAQHSLHTCYDTVPVSVFTHSWKNPEENTVLSFTSHHMRHPPYYF